MPAWWSKKGHKSSNKSNNDSPRSVVQGGGVLVVDSPKSISNKNIIINNNKLLSSLPNSDNKKKQTRSCELISHHRTIDDSFPGACVGGVSLRSPCTAAYSSGFSGFDSDATSCAAGKRECHPLPRPSVSSNTCHGFDHGCGGVGVVGLVNSGGGGGGSASVSSVSSSGSLDDTPPPLLLDHFGPSGIPSRGSDDVNLRIRPRSPGSGSKGATTLTSPLHPRSCGSNLDSSIGKLEDVKSLGHPLPLPPSSPTSPSAMHGARASFASENLNNNAPSKWMKGKLLGRGTFGHVYLGFNSQNGRMCAIKEVRLVSDDQNSRECLKQLNQEINLLSQLSHPNIVQYHGSELGEETLSVYLEYVSGGSIHKLLQEYGRFREPVIQNYTRQILSGLAYLHTRNTVHRDIKGANILVDPHGEIKLADFGMAKHITNCTSVLSFKGSPYWMAPEVVMNTNGYNLAVDIWSLGCTVLEMATAKPPWSQYEGVAAIFKIGNSKDIPEIPDYLSDSAKNFLRLCLQRDPSARPSAAELLDHPFVIDQGQQTMMRSPGLNLLTTEVHDGSLKPKALEINPRRKSISTYDAEIVRRSVVPVSRELWDNTRTIISLPVSPCSSPLRQSGPTYKSCFPSPPNPAYAWVGQPSQTSSDISLSPTRAKPSSYISDPWLDTLNPYRSRTPGGSPRTRLI